MKRILYYVLAAILLCGCGQSNKSKESTTVTNEMWQSEVIAPMKEALERFAMATPKISDIRVSEGAASKVAMMSDSLDALDEDSFNLYEAMYDLYSMQTYIAHGLSYFPSLLSLYGDIEEAHEGVRMLSTWNALLKNKSNERPLKWLSQIGLYSLYNYNVYFFSYDLMAEELFYDVDAHYEMLMSMQNYMGGIRILCPKDTVAFQHCCVFESSAFFMTFCPMIQRLCPRKIYEDKMHKDVIASAEWFDAKAEVLKKAVHDDIPPAAMSEMEFFEFMKESTKRKVQMLDFLTMAIDSMEPQKEE